MKKFIKKLAGVVAVVVCGTCMNACSCGEGKYIITLNSGVEGGNSSFEWVANKPFTKPEDPQRKGYVFDGWFADKELTVPYDFTSSVKGNITIFAKWIKCGQITLPEKSIGQNGYRVYLPEGEDNMLLIGESIEFILEISGNYLQDSNPVFKINGQELSYKEKLTEGFYEK